MGTADAAASDSRDTWTVRAATRDFFMRNGRSISGKPWNERQPTYGFRIAADL